jgi:transcriptional regulator with XRE-family HTH domain
MKRRSPVHAAFGDNVCARRLAQGMTQVEFSKKAGIHRTYLAEIESGVRNPSLSIIFQLARASKVSVGVLMKGV